VSLLINYCTDKEKWDGFVDSSPQGNIFCKTIFLNALGEDYDLLMVEEDNHIKMGAIILKQNGKPIKAPYPCTIYQGILFDNSLQNLPQHRRIRKQMEITQFLLRNLNEYYDRISFCLHYDVEDLRSFQWFNYHTPEKGQFSISLRYSATLELSNLTSFDNYLLDIRKVRRQEYNKAKASSLILEDSNDIEALDQLHYKTYKRQGIERAANEVRLLRAITQSALAKKYGQLMLCKNAEGCPIAAMVFLYDNRCAYYLFGANDPEYRKTSGGTYLMLENIRQCRERGLLKVDMVGINSPGRGDFKTSFNAVPVPYFIVHWEKPC
jgi:hypothetical protein